MGYFIIWIVACAVVGTVWGVVVQNVVENRGYEENWFWWGFFFGIFALIVAFTKPTIQHESELSLKKVQEKRNEDMLNSGGWQCNKCGKLLPAYAGTCGCGNTKTANKKELDISSATNNVDLIIKYKDLLDSGAITQEEFDVKKKELLK